MSLLSSGSRRSLLGRIAAVASAAALALTLASCSEPLADSVDQSMETVLSSGLSSSAQTAAQAVIYAGKGVMIEIGDKQGAHAGWDMEQPEGSETTEEEVDPNGAHAGWDMEQPGDATEPGSESARAQEIVANMTLEEKVAQMFFVTPEAITGVGCATQAGPATYAALEQYPVGGLIYFGQNLIDEGQTRQMLANTQSYAQEITGLPIFLGVDEEGGTVSRIGGNPGFPVSNVGNMCDVGATGDTQYAHDVAVTIGTYLTDLGFNVDFAPDADITDNPESWTMSLRSFGSSAEVAAPMVKAQVEGFTETGILSCVKHFPGLGGAMGDSHDTSVYSYDTLEQMQAQELRVFQAGMEADVPFVMVGHLSVPNVTGDDIPSSVNPGVITGILREQLGYDGLVTTDSLAMGAVVERYGANEAALRAVEAGVDVLLMPADFQAAYQAVIDAVWSGRISVDRIVDSVERIVETKLERL